MGLITNLVPPPPKAPGEPMRNPRSRAPRVGRLKPAPIGVEGTLGQRLTETGRSWIVQAAQVGAEFGGPVLLTIHPAQFLGPHGQVSALYRAEVAQPWTGHVREHVGPPAAPLSQPGARTLDAFTCGLHDGREGRAVDTRPG